MKSITNYINESKSATESFVDKLVDAFEKKGIPTERKNKNEIWAADMGGYFLAKVTYKRTFNQYRVGYVKEYEIDTRTKGKFMGYSDDIDDILRRLQAKLNLY